jgi:DNA-binding MarR family transcriptional regulator
MMDETKQEIIERLTRLQMLLHRRQAQTFMSFGPWGNPRRGQGRVLSILKIKPEISQRELTYLLGMSRQALAELLNKLEKNGYIEREHSESDRRSVNIRLTEKGAAADTGESDGFAPEAESMFADFSAEELSNLSDYLRRITERLEEQFSDGGEDLRRQLLEKLKEWRDGHVHGYGHEHEHGHEHGHGPGFGGGFRHRRGFWLGCRGRRYGL